jgi:hypothetical protein
MLFLINNQRELERIMKKKILGWFVCFLLIVTAVTVAESSKNITINPIVPNTSEKSMAGNWTEMQKLLASDNDAVKNFGRSVSIDGDTALIGAVGESDNTGSAYVFIHTGTSWTLQATLHASDGTANDQFGWSVSLDGDTALISASRGTGIEIDSGSAYVFTRTGILWTQQQKLLASDGATADYFGNCVSLDGDLALIGAYLDDDNGPQSGSAYMFQRIGTIWTQQIKLIPGDNSQDDLFGSSVSVYGNTALIGACGNNDNGNESGSAYVFTRTEMNWTQQAKILASDGAPGNWFGRAVSLYEDTALIGARYKDYGTGAAYVFIKSGINWTQQTQLLASEIQPGDNFGMAVSLFGDTALVGAYLYDHTMNRTGSAYVFTRNDTIWTQEANLYASDGAVDDWFGWSVALDGDNALIGAYRDDDTGEDSGSAYVFTKDGELPNLVIAIGSGIGINAVIINTGTANASVDWQIHVEGGILGLINKTVNGTIDILAGESKTVKTGFFFGLGPITVTVKAADINETTKGIYLFIFSMVKIPFPWIQID